MIRIYTLLNLTTKSLWGFLHTFVNIVLVRSREILERLQQLCRWRILYFRSGSW